MKIAIKTQKITDTKYLCARIHWQPFDNVNGLQKTELELISNGYLITEDINIPMPENQIGKFPQLYYNPDTFSFWYEYIDLPKTPEQLLEERLASVEIAMANMMGMGV